MDDMQPRTQIAFLQYNLYKKLHCLLRIPDSYDANIAKIRNFWTFLPVIQLITHLSKI